MLKNYPKEYILFHSVLSVSLCEILLIRIDKDKKKQNNLYVLNDEKSNYNIIDDGFAASCW